MCNEEGTVAVEGRTQRELTWLFACYVENQRLSLERRQADRHHQLTAILLRKYSHVLGRLSPILTGNIPTHIFAAALNTLTSLHLL